MKQIYIVLSILLSALNMGSAFAISALQYAALGSEKIVNDVINKVKAGTQITPSEKVKLEANLNSLSFTQPNTAQKYKDMIKKDSTLADTFPLFSKGIVIINPKTKKPATKKELESIQPEFRQEVKKDFDLLLEDPKEGTKEFFVDKSIATKVDSQLGNPTFTNIVDDEKNKFEQQNNVNVDQIIKKEEPKIFIGDIDDLVDLEINDYGFDVGPQIQQVKGAGREQVAEILTYLGDTLKNELDILKNQNLETKMGMDGYVTLYNKLIEQSEKFAMLQNLSLQDRQDITNELMARFNELWTIVTDDLLAQTREYKSKQGGLITRSEVYESIVTRCNKIEDAIKKGRVEKIDNSLIADIKTYILNYTKILNKDIPEIFSDHQKFNPSQQKKVAFSTKFAELFFGVDDLNDPTQTNHHSIRGLIINYKKYAYFLEENNAGEAQKYKQQIIQPLVAALNKIFEVFVNTLSNEASGACEIALTHLEPGN